MAKQVRRVKTKVSKKVQVKAHSRKYPKKKK